MARPEFRGTAATFRYLTPQAHRWGMDLDLTYILFDSWCVQWSFGFRSSSFF